MPSPFVLTGSTGFLGTAITQLATFLQLPVVPLSRDQWCQGIGQVDVYNPSEKIDLSYLSGCSTVIHAGARAHVLQETATDPLTVFRQANTAATLSLAEAAVSAGVQRFVFVSSIGVLGNHSNETSLCPTNTRAPVEPYAISKAEAEIGLLEIAARSALDIIIIRPPLVHGPGAKGNFRRLMETIWSGRPLPLGSARNRRSFVGVHNLAEALLRVAMSRTDMIPSAASTTTGCHVGVGARIYHIADDGVTSTRRLVEVLAEGMGVKPRMLSVPRWLAVGGATLLGKGAMARRLFDDLEVDDSDFRRDFDWRPKIGLEDGLRQMAEDFARRMRDGQSPSRT